jgi:Mg2+ and Co2+ transporter CorA
MEPITNSITKYIVIGAILLVSLVACYILFRKKERRDKVFGWIKKKVIGTKDKVKEKFNKTKQIAKITAAIKKLPQEERDVIEAMCDLKPDKAQG